jgi:hypothetical protein
MRKLAAKLVTRNLTEEQKDRRLTLCMGFAEQLQEYNFLDGVISIRMIPRPNASPWSGD